METNIVDNKTGIPLEHYREQFRTLNPEEAAQRCAAVYDAEKSRFILRFLSREVFLDYPNMEGIYADSGEQLKPAELILLGRFLLEGRYTPSTGKLLAYNEMPWGELYQANFKGRCILRLAYGFGFNIDGFKLTAAAIGGKPVEGGDAAFDIELLPGLNLRIILWQGDDEFPPSSQILFSDNFQFAFTAEDMAVVGDVTIDALKRKK